MLISRKKGYFTRTEKMLWIASVLFIVGSFMIFDRENYMILAASLIGATSLIYNAKGNPFGQLLMVVFSALYGVISLGFAYYGEMLTYLGMTAPMALFSLISWMRNPYNGNRAEVRVNRIGRREWAFAAVVSAAVTVAFYFVLEACGTANIVPSTVSVTTSFMAVYLTFRRSAYYALAYAANDVVLIVLWCLASLEDPAYVSVVVCFSAFLVNDLYGLVCWRRMCARQSSLS